MPPAPTPEAAERPMSSDRVVSLLSSCCIGDRPHPPFDEAQMTEGEEPCRESQSGQAAVESAIATPMTMFVVLGLIQIGMIQQARFFVDYAAYRGVKACSV